MSSFKFKSYACTVCTQLIDRRFIYTCMLVIHVATFINITGGNTTCTRPTNQSIIHKFRHHTLNCEHSPAHDQATCMVSNLTARLAIHVPESLICTEKHLPLHAEYSAFSVGSSKLLQIPLNTSPPNLLIRSSQSEPFTRAI
jgi:hypothetical protein